jgi:hypothetical protein
MKPGKDLFSVIDNNIPYNSCFFTSFLFLTNALSGWYYDDGLYTFLFTFLFMASILYHATYIRLMYMVDQVLCGSVVGYTLWLWTTLLPLVKTVEQTNLALTYIISLSYVIFSYYYGEKVRMFSHHPNKTIGNYFHSFLYTVACVGCHAVLLLQHQGTVEF